MNTCHDCICYKVCKRIDERLDHNMSIKEAESTLCKDFKNKENVVVPPLSINQKVYRIQKGEIVTSAIAEITIIEKNTFLFNDDIEKFFDAQIGITAFTDYEAAKAALEKQINNN